MTGNIGDSSPLSGVNVVLVMAYGSLVSIVINNAVSVAFKISFSNSDF